MGNGECVSVFVPLSLCVSVVVSEKNVFYELVTRVSLIRLRGSGYIPDHGNLRVLI